MIGAHLGHYEILEKLGAGGMGEVYKARDSRLNRLVALKILSGQALSNPDRRLRFMHEARAASALNHPNIVTVYDIAADGDTPYIAMEYVDGKTLDALIGRHGLRISEALRYAITIADALAAAHEAGIVHRDLKPSNVMVTDKGVVKVVDFGLAKLAEVSEEAIDGLTRTLQPDTEEGTILGTASYMSPEQAQGKKVDARSDIFSFGLVLYEMVTGRRAFSCDNKVSTLAAILNQEPKTASQITAGLPQEVDRILALCLRKDPARRFQHMEDVRISLEAAKEESDSMSGTAAQAVPTARRAWRLPAAGAVLVLAAAAAWYFLRPPAHAVAELKITPLTSYAGTERDPTFSPDGTQVAFSWNGDRQNNFDIYVRLVAGGTPLRLTTDPASDLYPAWSPDGTQIAFDRPGHGVFVISPLGGAERQVSESAHPMAWTPDGKALVIPERNNENEPYQVNLVTVSTGERRPLTRPAPKTYGDLDPAVSPDGKTLAFVRWLTYVGVSDLYLVPIGGGEPRRLTTDGLWIYNPVWTPDGSEIIFSSNRAGNQTLWRTAAAGGPLRQLAYVQGDARASAFSAPGHGKPLRFAYGASIQDDDIWSLDLQDGTPKKVISSTRRDWSGQFSPDGQRIAFSTDRSGNFEIWVAHADGSNPVQVTSFAGGVLDSPRWSPDGKRIAFAALAGSNRDIYIVSASGGSTRRLTTEPSEEGRPSWSKDGNTIYFRSDRSGSQQIWKMPAEGGTAVQVTRRGGFEAFESPDGTLLFFTKNRNNLGLWSIPVGGGEESKIIDGVMSGYWGVYDKGICFVDSDAAANVRSVDPLLDPTAVKLVKMYSFDSRETKQVASIDKTIRSPAPAFSVTRDGRSILWTQMERASSDLVLVENFR
jgi:Tol biopolymer transport system component/tRNA A-37 threonylcarbamoyl transferase component Bud32